MAHTQPSTTHQSSKHQGSNHLTRRDVWTQAWPIILSQATIPLVSVVDTAVIGGLGDATILAGVAVGASVINFIFWTFGFLRMGLTGLTSQASGADDASEVQSLLIRALLLGAGLGLALMALQTILLPIALGFFDVEGAALSHARDYATARFWGAPAALAVYALNGWLLGLGRTRAGLALQIIMNVTNIACSLWFVLGLHMGARGVGLGTAAAEWIALVSGALICLTIIGKSGGWRADALRLSAILNPHRLARMFAVNANIMIRTIALLLLLAWFTRSSARQGDTVLAANHILMQMLTVSAFVLDAFAFTAEARVGAAIGRKSRADFWRAVRLTGEFALSSAIAFTLLGLFAGGAFINALTSAPDVQAIARTYLPFAAAIPLLGVAAWMLDGIFVGAVRSADMRNSALVYVALYIALDISLRPLGNWGVWIAMSASYLLRAAALGVLLPGLVNGIPVDDAPRGTTP